jgi:hypothetical protein
MIHHACDVNQAVRLPVNTNKERKNVQNAIKEHDCNLMNLSERNLIRHAELHCHDLLSLQFFFQFMKPSLPTCQPAICIFFAARITMMLQLGKFASGFHEINGSRSSGRFYIVLQ